MIDVYGGLKWLKMEQAVHFLALLTEKPFTEELLIQYGTERKMTVYVDISIPGVEGTTSGTKEKVTLLGIQEVLIPEMTFKQTEEPTCAVLRHNDAHWIGLLPSWNRKVLFKSADIQALAAKINNKGERSDAAELEDLRRQFELAQANLEGAKASRETLHLRCLYTHQLLESTQAENAQLRELLADSDAKLKQQTIEQHSSQVEALAIGITFPYVTKHLEAMRDAAIKHWSKHDRAKPAPYGIQKVVQNFLIERTGENSRKVAELAAAIKPDDLPKL